MPEAGSTSPNLVTDIGVAKSSRKKKRRAGPSLTKVAVGVATKNKTREILPNPNPTKPGSLPSKKGRKELDFNLNCWNLWWKRMEREAMNLKVTTMQRPASAFMMQMRDNCTGRISTNYNRVPAQHLSTTPVKRKSELRMDPEISSHHSEIESPAKRRRKFMNLVKYWGGEQGRGADGATQYVNTPQTLTANQPQSMNSNSKIHKQITAQTKKLPKSDIYLGCGGGESESGHPAEMDLEGEE